MQGVTPGRVVHYVSDFAPKEGQELAATITGVVNDAGLVNLDVHSDTPSGIFHCSMVPFDETGKQSGTWHWLERV